MGSVLCKILCLRTLSMLPPYLFCDKSALYVKNTYGFVNIALSVHKILSKFLEIDIQCSIPRSSLPSNFL